MLDTIKQLRDAADALEAAMAPVPYKPPRILTIMAKNVQCGDYVNFEGFGWCEVNGLVNYAHTGDTIMSAMGTGAAVHTFPGNQRVQVRRYL